MLLACLVAYVCAGSITCGLCMSGLSQMIGTMQNTPGALDQLGMDIARSCEDILNKQQRMDCRQIMNEHFDKLFNNFVSNDRTNPSAMCVKMGYCP